MNIVKNENLQSNVPSHVLDLLLNVILDVLKGQSGSIMLAENNSNELTIQSARGLKNEIIRNARVRLGSGISGKVATCEQPVYIKGVNGERRLSINSGDLVKPEIDTSYIIPIKFHDGSMGTINVNSVDIHPDTRKEKNRLIQNILTRFYEYLLQTELPVCHHDPPSQLYMMNVFREYNVLRELRIVFDYIFQLITDFSAIQKKGVFCLKNRESGFFDLVVGYGFEPGNYRDIYEGLVPCLKSPQIDTEHSIRIFNKDELTLAARTMFKEKYLILLPLSDGNGKEESLQGQLVLFNDERPKIDHHRELFRIICSSAAAVIKKSNSNSAFHDLTYTDSLTGTYNYGLWWKRLHEEFSRVKREQNFILSLLLLDVDRFNNFNLSHGYLAGDQLLRFIADKIKSCVRSNDIVGRIGGEEFGVILIKSTKDSALMIARRILTAVSNIPEEMRINFKHPITLSGGIACLPDDADAPLSLVEKAQTAMVSAKIMGGNCIKTFDHLEE